MMDVAVAWAPDSEPTPAGPVATIVGRAKVAVAREAAAIAAKRAFFVIPVAFAALEILLGTAMIN